MELREFQCSLILKRRNLCKIREEGEVEVKPKQVRTKEKVPFLKGKRRLEEEVGIVS
jgi:hypothetical protein